MLNRRNLIAASVAVPALGMSPAVFAAPAMAPETSGATIMMREIENLDAASGGTATLSAKLLTKIAQLVAERERLAEIEKRAAEAADKAWAAWERVARSIPDDIIAAQGGNQIMWDWEIWSAWRLIERRRPKSVQGVTFDLDGALVIRWYITSAALRAEIADPATMMDGVTVNADHFETCKALLPRVEAFEAKCARARRRTRAFELADQWAQARDRLEDGEEAILAETATCFEDLRAQCELAISRADRDMECEQLEDMVRGLAQSAMALSERARLAA